MIFRSLKVRIIEYDASGFNQNTENSRHEEFLVRQFIKHPNFDPKRLSDNIAVLILDRPINLLRNKGVNAACYPRCKNIVINYLKFNSTTPRDLEHFGNPINEKLLRSFCLPF